MVSIRRDNESGFAMIIVLIVIMLSAILGATYMNIVAHESKHAVWQKHRVQSLFLAEAGIQKTIFYMNLDDPDNLPENNPLLVAEEISDRIDYVEQLTRPEYEFDGKFKVSLYGRDYVTDPDNIFPSQESYLVKSVGVIERENSGDIEHMVAAIVGKLDGFPTPAAVSILPDMDRQEDDNDELLNFNSVQWTIDGHDHDMITGELIEGNPGVLGIYVNNDGEDAAEQLGSRVDQVTGALVETDEEGNIVYQEPNDQGVILPVVTDEDAVGADAIYEHPDPESGMTIDIYMDYFESVAVDVGKELNVESGGKVAIPEEYLGTQAEPTVLYLDLDKADYKIAALTQGWGILMIEGDGTFEMAGNAGWHGLVICAGEATIVLEGGGHTAAHIYGAVIVNNGALKMTGTADVKYSSGAIGNAWTTLRPQIMAWSEGWGDSLTSYIIE